MLRLIVLALFIAWFIYFLGRIVIMGLRTGRIAHSDSQSFCSRSKNPIAFWALILLFSAMITAFAVFLIQEIVAMLAG